MLPKTMMQLGGPPPLQFDRATIASAVQAEGRPIGSQPSDV